MPADRANQVFDRFYYRHSPKVADFIRDKEPLKAIVRAGLRPLVQMCRLIERANR